MTTVRRRAGLLIVVLTAGLWVSALVAAPRPSRASDGVRPMAAAAVYAAGSLICHQRPERSFHLAGAQLPVCARCLGLYVGGFIGALAWVLVAGVGAGASDLGQRVLQPRVLRTLLCWSAVPTLVTVIAAALGWWDATNQLRALLAAPLGLAIGGLVCAAASRDLR
jgi:uncharacterized membrane protein